MPILMERRGDQRAGEGGQLVLAELKHRVRNELQIALSALRLAKRGLESAEQPVRFIEEAERRIEGLGDAHCLLDPQMGQQPLSQRLEALCRATSRAWAAPLGVQLMLTLDDVAADEETTWTVCVVAAELMTNALKHAFPDGIRGVIGVILRQEGSQLLLTVTDNGVGAARSGPHGAAWRTGGYGSGIVARLAERVGGLVTRVSGPVGTTVTFCVPDTVSAPSMSSR